MDEPLGTLDAEFRELMCLELRKLHNDIKATTVYVTHDQLEAMSMGDRIAVMNKGKIVQFGTPREIYLRPRNKFVGSFIGSPAMNFIPIHHSIEKNQDKIVINGENYDVPQSIGSTNSTINYLGIRPEKMFLTDKKGISGVVFGSEYLGARKILTIKSEFCDFKVRVTNQTNAQIGSNVRVNFDQKSGIIFDGKTDNAIESKYIKLN